MRRQITAILFLTAGLMAQSTASEAVSFTQFVSGGNIYGALSNNSTIGFTYAGNKFVGSVYYGTNNNRLFQTDLNGQNVQPFGPAIPGAGGEIYVSSSLGLGGFPSRDIYAAQGSGIYHITNDGTTGNVFTSGLNGGVRGIAFDPYGLYGNEMIVTTSSGYVYRINSSGVKSVLASVGEDTEGLDFTPQAFGPYGAGTLVVASEWSGSLRAISPTGSVSNLGISIPSAEMLSFVPLTLGSSGSPLEGFYAARFPYDIVKAGASQFTSYLGDAIVTSETNQHVYQVHWNGSSFTTADLGWLGGQPEDGIFVTAKILNPTSVPEPSTLLLLGSGLGGFAFIRRFRKR